MTTRTYRLIRRQTSPYNYPPERVVENPPAPKKVVSTARTAPSLYDAQCEGCALSWTETAVSHQESLNEIRVHVRESGHRVVVDASQQFSIGLDTDASAS